MVMLYGYWFGYMVSGLVICLLDRLWIWLLFWVYDYWIGYMVIGLVIWLLVWLYGY